MKGRNKSKVKIIQYIQFVNPIYIPDLEKYSFSLIIAKNLELNKVPQMKLIYKIFFAISCGWYFLLFLPSHVSAFLGEDLGLELYKNIDEWLATLEQKQYEYEIEWQWETSIEDFAKANGLNCNISSASDIDKLAGIWISNYVAYVVWKCGGEDGVTPIVFAENIKNKAIEFRNSYRERASDKAKRTYEIARIWLYSDGNLENSPFDLMYDIVEIDKIIFGEELKYEWVEYENADDTLDSFLEEDKGYLYEDDNKDSVNDSDNSWDNGTNTGNTVDNPLVLVPDIEDNKYICLPKEEPSGLSDDAIKDIINDIEGTSGTWSYVPNPYSWIYPDWVVTNGASWGWPFPGVWPDWSYQDVRDSWKCGNFFCIIIEFQKSNYGLAGWETMSIKKILTKAAKHLEKPANASLTQRKQTINNFELGSIIKNLPDMLRGFGIEVQSKPIPILDLESENEKILGDDTDEIETMLARYYKNLGLDYERRNDLHNFWNVAEESKIFQTAAGMPITYPEMRYNELTSFQAALRENNRLLARNVDNQILTDDMRDFVDQFSELEKFVDAMEDFVKSIKGVVSEMGKIPTRSS